MQTRGRTFIGISGYDYKGWRGRFYPQALPARRWLEYASRRCNSIELNGTFYSLKSPRVFERWVAEVPERDFVFAVKGGRFITHNLKLRNAEASLGNFFASGVLLLGDKTGPFLWQLPAPTASTPTDSMRSCGCCRVIRARPKRSPGSTTIA